MLGTVITPIDRILRWDPIEEAKAQLQEMEGEYNEGHVEELAKRLDEKFRTQKIESLQELNETYNGMSWKEFLNKVDSSLIGFEKVWSRESAECREILFFEKTRSILLFGEGVRHQAKDPKDTEEVDEAKNSKLFKISLRRACMAGVLQTSEQPEIFLVDLKSCLRKGDKLYDLDDGCFRILLDMTDALTYRVLVLDLLPGKKWVSRKIPIDVWLLSKADQDESNRDYSVMMKLLRAKIASLPKEVQELLTDED